MSDIQKPPINLAISLMGGVASTVRLLGLKGHATVYQWTKTRVPAEYCPRIEAATAGKVRCEDLRPDVAWGVLRSNNTLPELVQDQKTPTAQQTHAQPAPETVSGINTVEVHNA